MRWTLPADTGQRRELDAYCSAVGPALLYEPPGAGTAATMGTGAGEGAGEDHARAPAVAEPAAEGLVVVAWNMALGGGDLERLVASLRDGRYTGGPPAHFVLLLQEVPRIGPPVPPADALPDGARTSSTLDMPGPDIRRLAEATGLHLLYVPSTRKPTTDGRDVDQGAALLSTLPLAEPRAIEMAHGIRRRVAVAARVTPPGFGTSVHVVSAHLDNFAFSHFAGSFGSIRARQARSLLPALRQMAAAGEPVLLGADLNTWLRGPQEAAARVVREVLPLPTPLTSFSTADRLGVPRRLDYVLAAAPAGWEFVEYRIDDRYGSDHNPVLGLLRPAGTQQFSR